MAHRNFVVTGCARSGLGRTARMLSALGAECGHEDVFHPDHFRAGPTLHWPARLAGDASWFAAPVLAKLPGGTFVLHQVRDPLAVISEIWGSGFFQRPSEDRWFAEDFLGGDESEPALERAMRLWVHWNHLIEESAELAGLVYRRQRAEDLDAAALFEIAEVLGVARHRAVCGNVFGRLGTRAESDFAPRRLGWADLPTGTLADDVAALAERYGYPVPRGARSGLRRPA